jgi:hypothetical protein
MDTCRVQLAHARRAENSIKRGAELDIDPVSLNDLAAHADRSLQAIRHRFIAKMQPPGESLGIAKDRSARSRLDRSGYGVGRATGREVHSQEIDQSG